MVPSTSSRKASLLKSGGSEGSTFGMSCIRATIVEAVAPKGAEPPERYAKAGQQPPPALQPFDSAKVPAKNFGRGRRPCGRCGSNADEVASQLHGCLRPKAPCRHRPGEAAR